MYCKYCGKDNKKDANFCINCGKPISTASHNTEKVTDSINIKTKKTHMHYIILGFTIIVITSITIPTASIIHKKSVQKGIQITKQSKMETLKKAYTSLIQEGDTLLSSNKNEAINKYNEAKTTLPSKEDAYIKLLKLYITDSNVSESKDLIKQIYENVNEPSTELKSIIENEKEKDWYLVNSKISVFQIENDTSDAYKLVAGEMNSVLAETYDCYYKYDDYGRLIESNAGSLPMIYAQNDGSYRTNNSRSIIDRDIFVSREGEDADYALYCCGGYYYYPDNIDGNNIFTYQYNEDGTITETVTRDGQLKNTNQYTFNGNLLSGIKSGITNDLYTDFKYNNSYVSYRLNGKNNYWEESYDSEGRLNNFVLEFNEADLDFVASNQDSRKYFKDKSISNAKFQFYFNDTTDEYGNIIRREQKYDIIGGLGVGRNFDGTYFDWATLQKGILSKIVEYKYVYCKPDEINN